MTLPGPARPKSRDVAATLAVLGVLAALGLIPPALYRYVPNEDAPIKKVLRTVKKRGLNREATAKQTAGYYEGLLDQAAAVTEMGGAGLFDWRFWFVERRQRARVAPQVRRERDDFLRFDLPPNADVPELGESRRLITNSHGLADREYQVGPPPGTWRIALVGDSVSRGMGAEFGTSYETRLEARLNAATTSEDAKDARIEVLNFSVQGYQLTQLVDVALDRAPRFDPDVYVVALTDRSVFRVWADHLASVVRNGVDLKYDFLKRIVQEAGVTPNLSTALVNARLAPYRVEVIRWAFRQMQDQADEAGSHLVVLLVPTPDDAEMQIEQFKEVKVILDDMGITAIDLLETFAYLEDLAPVRVSSSDRHPNEEGHRMLFEALWNRIESSSDLRSVFLGPRN